MASSIHKIHFLDQMKSTGILPVFHHTHTTVLFQVLRTLNRGGMSVLEFKHTRDQRSVRAFAQLIELASEFPGFTLGAGTVLDAALAHQYIKAGAQFISSPFLHKEVASICEDYNVMWMPGCSTRDEVEEAIQLNAKVINIVQGNVPALDVLMQCARDFSDRYFIPSAGIELDKHNVPLLFEAGALCLRMGDSLFHRNNILTKDWTRMEINFYQTMKNMRRIKHSATVTHDYFVLA